ncbi:MAG TPA: type II toxin-antitoxin system RelE/ParE family toxin [Longimicrobium sp.]|nr:type II toxin-antitoxin system RelE/ParE family toxin [Longimicrobium sp.]
MRLRVHPLAVREINEAADRYKEISADAEDRFTLAVERAFERVREHPQIGEEVVRGERRLVLRRFPYKLIYRPRPAWIFIVAIAHHKRRDGYWRKRREPVEW